MNEEIQKKLREFHKYNIEARKHFRAYELKPDEPIHMHTEVDLMQYSKWRTKADIALNEFHALLAQQQKRAPWPLKQLSSEYQELVKKLKFAEDWLEEHKN